MNLAFLFRSKAVASLQSWAHQLLSGHTVCPTPLASGGTICAASPLTLRPALPSIQPCLQARRPLRVVRVVESGQPRAHVGRMVISGRMADVCAELDRLAAREAAENCVPRGVTAISCG